MYGYDVMSSPTSETPSALLDEAARRRLYDLMSREDFFGGDVYAGMGVPPRKSQVSSAVSLTRNTATEFEIRIC
jgi:hypothetical protein